MSQLFSFALLLFTSTTILFVASSDEVDSNVPVEQKQQSSSLYDELCINPDSSIRSKKFSIKNLDEVKKWYLIFGSDVVRQNFGTMLKGRYLLRNDSSEYEGMCLEGNTPFAQLEKIAVGTHSGFGKLDQAIYNCMPNEDLPGSYKCLQYNVATKLHVTDFWYTVDTEEENVHVVVVCYPDNEVGWVTHTLSPTLTKDEYAAAKKQSIALGFDGENIVQMHDENCNNV